MDDMATVLRSNISKSNPYYIPKERYLELKHFCMQYSYWQKRYLELEPSTRSSSIGFSRLSGHSDPTAHLAVERASYAKKMQMVEQSAIEADSTLYNYILKAVIDGLSYTNLYTYYEIPCSKDTYYDRYRKFFYILDKRRD